MAVSSRHAPTEVLPRALRNRPPHSILVSPCLMRLAPRMAASFRRAPTVTDHALAPSWHARIQPPLR
eukprot:7192661-Alexandrium_andersonii.AAC.1